MLISMGQKNVQGAADNLDKLPIVVRAINVGSLSAWAPWIASTFIIN